MLNRYARELTGSEVVSGPAETVLWKLISDYTPDFLRRQPGGVVLRIGAPLSKMRDVFKSVSGAVVCRAGSGVSYVYLSSWRPAAPILALALERDWTAAVEHAPDEVRAGQELWIEQRTPGVSASFDIMEKIKKYVRSLEIAEQVAPLWETLTC